MRVVAYWARSRHRQLGIGGGGAEAMNLTAESTETGLLEWSARGLRWKRAPGNRKQLTFCFSAKIESLVPKADWIGC
jgi:hypothetical protein